MSERSERIGWGGVWLSAVPSLADRKGEVRSRPGGGAEQALSERV